jgi:hypothetical protein
MTDGIMIRGLPDTLTTAVRQTLRSPEYGHPVMREVASGTGPCRACLSLFDVGSDERLLFTYRPSETDGTLGAPGPVFIHAEECPRYEGTVFPPTLRELPLLFEARAGENRVLASRRATGEAVEEAMAELLANPAVTHLYIRHGEAGCHIARVERRSGGAPAAVRPAVATPRP